MPKKTADNKNAWLGRRRLLQAGGVALGLGAISWGLHGLLAGSATNQDQPEAFTQLRKNRHPASGVEVSALGYGCMRFPVLPEATSPRDSAIDEQAAFRLLDYAFAAGINYFDTAYFYHKGASEEVLGKAMSRYPREKYLLADKMPGRVIESLPQAKEVFFGQLKKLRTDYVDFYQLHAVMSVPDYKRVYEELGVLDFLLEQREKGVIRHLGWSFHGDSETLEYLLAHNPGWDYAMLQLNYHDLLHQLVIPEERAKKIGLRGQPAPARWMYESVRAAGLPIVVMEPLLGGRLARLSKKARKPLERARPDLTPANWAFRYVGNLPGVLTVLSGMTYMDHLRENLRVFAPLEPFSQQEEAALREALKLFLNQESIRCTTCGYCMPCPYGVDIPAIFTHFNHGVDDDYYPENPDSPGYATQAKTWLGKYDQAVPRLRQAVRCTGCGKCKPACPAMIDIPEEMARIGRLEESLRNGARL